jgi:hypothetical protein
MLVICRLVSTEQIQIVGMVSPSSSHAFFPEHPRVIVPCISSQDGFPIMIIMGLTVTSPTTRYLHRKRSFHDAAALCLMTKDIEGSRIHSNEWEDAVAQSAVSVHQSG